ncbi:MAG: rhodanese-like domain-containing protein [Pedobacter sp.]
MKFKSLLLTTLIVITGLGAYSQQQSAVLKSNPWLASELLQPLALVTKMKSEKVLIYNIGVEDDIQGTVHIGAASEPEKLQLFKNAIKSASKDKMVVIYCGCCPMNKCPNIRPAFQALKAAKFKKAYLLNLPTNLKTDWISKGLPLAKS